MLKKTIKYTDYNGTERTEDFYFNISQGELIDMNFTTEGGLENHLQKIIQANEVTALYKNFKELIFKSYGEKSQDGKRFIKSAELSLAFSQTEAYSQFLTELVTDANIASTFVNGIMPPPDPHAIQTVNPVTA